MKLIATMPVRNEAWCVRASIASLLKWCDELIVLNHAGVGGRDESGVFAETHYIYEPDPVWREAKYRQRLLEAARWRGATHVVTIDADEILTANKIGAVREAIERLRPGEVLRVPWLMLWGSLDRYRAGDGSVWSTARAPLAFRADGPGYTDGGYDIHTRVPAGLRSVEVWPDRDGGLMHLQHVSRRRVVAKQVLYRLNEVLRFGTPAAEIERRYGPTTDEAGLKLRAVPADWWGEHCWGPERDAIDAEREPWQEAEVRRILAEHGRARFAGLDLHGLELPS